jgi:aminoglycoside phosphotransferase
MRTMETPSPDVAAVAVQRAMGWQPVAVSRFPTGAAHFVFEARAADGAVVVVRMGRLDRREAMVKGTRLARCLRALGVPLPAILGEDLDQEFPYVVMERLPGTDLAHVIGSLSDPELHGIALRVA